MEKTPLIGMTDKELQDVVVRLGMPKFVGRQLAQWIYEKRAVDFEEMANISKKNKTLLAEESLQSEGVCAQSNALSWG